MSCIIEGLLETNKVNELDIIETIDICNYIHLKLNDNVNNKDYNIVNNFIENNVNENVYESTNLYENNFVNNNENKNINYNSNFEKYINLHSAKNHNQNNFTNNYNSNNSHEVTELLSLSIEISDKTIKKIINKNTCIYIINFIYYINIKLCINDTFKEIKVKDMYSKSLKYKEIDIRDIDIYPINLDLKNLENKISFGINCIIIDKSEDINLENCIEPKEQIRENIGKKDYSYIDINQEFI